MGKKYLDKLLSKIDGKPKDYNKQLNGISGLTFIFVVFCIFMAFISLINIVIHIGYLSSPEIIAYTIFMLAFFLPLDVGLKIAIIVFVFKKNIIFRKLYVINALLIIVSMMSAFVYLLVSQIDFYETAIIHSILAAVWIIYLYNSKRIKNTFIYPYSDYAKQERAKIMAIAEQ